MKCDLPAAFRFTWPGENESYICSFHALKLKNIALAMGVHIQTIPIEVEDEKTFMCGQSINEQP